MTAGAPELLTDAERDTLLTDAERDTLLAKLPFVAPALERIYRQGRCVVCHVEIFGTAPIGLDRCSECATP